MEGKILFFLYLQIQVDGRLLIFIDRKTIRYFSRVLKTQWFMSEYRNSEIQATKITVMMRGPLHFV